MQTVGNPDLALRFSVFWFERDDTPPLQKKKQKKKPSLLTHPVCSLFKKKKKRKSRLCLFSPDWHIRSFSSPTARCFAAPLGGFVSLLVFSFSPLPVLSLQSVFFFSQKWFTGTFLPCSPPSSCLVSFYHCCSLDLKGFDYVNAKSKPHFLL